jgi:hypothetical protein
MNAKVNWIFVEYNGVSMIGGNCKKLPMNIMFISRNDNILDFDFCNFKCIVANMLQLTIEISSIIMNSIMGHISIIEFFKLTVAYLLVDKPNKKWIVISRASKVVLAIYGVM